MVTVEHDKWVILHFSVIGVHLKQSFLFLLQVQI